MNFRDMIRGFLGSEVEVLTANDYLDGTLISIDETTLVLQIPPIIYGPPGDVAVVPLSSVELVRVLAV
ncbi:hypothetical protein PUW24_17180 [Paenibacillus urinalis]|uniref:DUF2642 domain-containing protein n=2 Tax=Paenibacillus TaxID=44249 RepID=A0AAX3N6W6_9BACL|nr:MULTISPECIES: hypothetical protein [Paenibacillus]OMC71056.1 hypothetical protein BK126_02785 [Paenibacillus sp. FSL H7-0326]WDH84449.1 hypothetical protein PUW23_09665 [Paenibacillus urinalis]WDH95915.1 hypothetical protein PUW24_17180 [Paenibacillus urinalis]WDI04133.1 hypothetical protein PUW25_09360 [Paenibacillus urinalis]SDW17389.1 hypothetical protein SAMN05518848_101509 [Paenibacillus sp. PDC88]